MKFPGNISISRVTSNQEESIIRIQVDDELSGCRFAEVNLTLENFALVVTGRSEVDCSVEFQDQAPIGQCRESKEVLIPLPDEQSREEAAIQALLAPHEVDGWKAGPRAMENMHNFSRNKNGVLHCRFLLVRYVDRKETS